MDLLFNMDMVLENQIERGPYPDQTTPNGSKYISLPRSQAFPCTLQKIHQHAVDDAVLF